MDRSVLSVDLHTQHVDRGRHGGSAAVRVVVVDGEVDLTTTSLLAEAIAHAHGPDLGLTVRRVVVDTSAMTFCGARGLHALARGAELALACGGVYAVAGLSRRLETALLDLWPAPHPVLCRDRTAAFAVVTGSATRPPSGPLVPSQHSPTGSAGSRSPQTLVGLTAAPRFP